MTAARNGSLQEKLPPAQLPAEKKWTSEDGLRLLNQELINSNKHNKTELLLFHLNHASESSLSKEHYRLTYANSYADTPFLMSLIAELKELGYIDKDQSPNSKKFCSYHYFDKRKFDGYLENEKAVRTLIA